MSLSVLIAASVLYAGGVWLLVSRSLLRIILGVGILSDRGSHIRVGLGINTIPVTAGSLTGSPSPEFLDRVALRSLAVHCPSLAAPR